MAITASGVYLKTEEKMRIDTAGQSMESETAVKSLLVNDTYTPDFDVHDFRDDVTNEIANSGNYATGGITTTTTDITIGAPAAGTLKWDFDDLQWASSTIASAMAAIQYFNVGSAATDMLLQLMDFVTAVSTSNGLLLVTIHANGARNDDLTP